MKLKLIRFCFDMPKHMNKKSSKIHRRSNNILLKTKPNCLEETKHNLPRIYLLLEFFV